MENTTKKCRECKADIPADAKVCQHCKAKQGNWFIRHKFLTVILVLIIIIALWANWSKNQSTTGNGIQTKTQETTKKDTTISIQEFEQIKSGMTYQEVVALIWTEGEILSESEIANIKTTMYKFTGDGFWANANITIQNGKVMAKAQFWLK
jgi:hypothetical protein